MGPLLCSFATHLELLALTLDLSLCTSVIAETVTDQLIDSHIISIMRVTAASLYLLIVGTLLHSSCVVLGQINWLQFMHVT